jgi:lipopolysaccharide transport system ATP-binding protein
LSERALPMDAIVIENVTKHFRKSTVQRHHTTLKTEVVRWFRRQRRQLPQMFIQSLNGINLRVPQGQTVGIIGRNGAGKSTLLKIITGIYTPSSGTVEVNGRISALLDLGAGFHPDFSGRENILINGIILGMSRNEIRARMEAIIDFSELSDFIDEPVRTYSSGMYMRLAFAVATHVDPDILVIDEILAVGDEHFSRKSRAKMNEFKSQGKTIVLVTHDLNTVQTWCDWAVWIDAGRIQSVGNPREVVHQYRDAVALADAQTSVGPAPGSSTRLEPLADPASVGAGETDASARIPIELGQLHLLNQFGHEVSAFLPNDSLDVCLDFWANTVTDNATFSISIVRAEGDKIFATDTRAESVPLPKPLPSFGRLYFRIEQLNLGDGAYTVDVIAQVEGMSQPQRRVSNFSVESGLPDSGLVRLPHRWTFETLGSPASQLHRAAGS